MISAKRTESGPRGSTGQPIACVDRIILVLCLCWPLSARSGFELGGDVVAFCAEPSAHCIAYLTGVVDGIDAMGWERVSTQVCVPDRVEGFVVRALFLEYAEAHPEYLGLPAGLLVLDTLKRAWPCD